MRRRWIAVASVVLVAALLGGGAAVLGIFEATERTSFAPQRESAPPSDGKAPPSGKSPHGDPRSLHDEARKQHAETESSAPKEGDLRDGANVIDDADDHDHDDQAQPGRSIIQYGGLHGRVVDGEREPVHGLQVEITMHDLLVYENGEARRVTKRDVTLTDAQGRFRFEGLQANAGPSYTVRLLPKTEGALPALRHVPYLPENELLNVGTLRLRMEAVLHGRVLDPSGRPVAGARVVLARGSSGEGPVRRTSRLPTYRLRALGFSDDPIPLRIETTTEDGSFRFDGLEPFHYEVRAQASPHRDSSVHSVSLAEGEENEPLSLRLRAALSLEVDVRDRRGTPVEGATVTPRLLGPQHRGRSSSSQTTDHLGRTEFNDLADFFVLLSIERRGYLPTEKTVTLAPRAERAPLRVTLIRATRLRGRLAEPDGEPLPEETVWLRLHNVEGLGEARTRTDERGYFEFPDLAPAPVTLEARQTRFGPFFLEPGSLGDLDTLVVPQTGTLAVEVRDADGQPVAQAELAVQPLEASRKTFVRTHSAAAAVTDAEGFAELAVSAGTYAFRVEAQGLAAHTPAEPLVVEAGESYPIQVTLSAGGDVVGTVRNERDRPVSIPVQLIRKGGPQTDWVREAESDAQGRFEFTHVTPGIYRVRAAAPGRASSRPFTWFEVREGQVTTCEVTTRMQRASLWLSVRNQRTPVLVTIAELHGVEGSIHSRQTVHAQQRVRHSGQFGNLPVGRTLVAFVAANPNRAPFEFTVGNLEAGRNRVTLEMPGSHRLRRASSSLHGQLTYRGEDRPVAGVSLRLQGSFAGGMQPVRRAMSDSDGRFRFERLAPGDYRLTVTAPGRAASVHEVKIGRDDDVQRDIEVDEAGYLLFAVHVEAPAPEMLLRATAQIEGHAATHTQVVHLGELIVFSNVLRNEIYEIHITAERHGSYRGTYLVRAGDTSIVHVTLNEQ